MKIFFENKFSKMNMTNYDEENLRYFKVFYKTERTQQKMENEKGKQKSIEEQCRRTGHTNRDG